MKSRNRTVLGILLFVPLAAVILATFACLPAPVGDAEKSKVDPGLVGAYRLVPPDPASKDEVMALLRPWDQHTYFLQYMGNNKSDPSSKPELMQFKAWLTTFGGGTFLTCQPMDDLGFATGNSSQSEYWVVLRLDKVADGLQARMVDADSPLLKDVIEKSKDDPKALSAAIEGVIAAHANEDALFTKDPLHFKKLGKDDSGFIVGTAGDFHLPVEQPAGPVNVQPAPAPKPDMP